MFFEKIKLPVKNELCACKKLLSLLQVVETMFFLEKKLFKKEDFPFKDAALLFKRRCHFDVRWD